MIRSSTFPNVQCTKFAVQSSFHFQIIDRGEDFEVVLISHFFVLKSDSKDKDSTSFYKIGNKGCHKVVDVQGY